MIPRTPADHFEALKYGACGFPLQTIAHDALDAVAGVVEPWGADAARRLAGRHPMDEAMLIEAISEVIGKALNDHALFIRDHAGSA